MDEAELLDDEGVKKYQSLIRSQQWAISLGRFDIACAVQTMSSFRAAPCIGHLNRVKRITGYLRKFKEAKIRFRTHMPDFTDIQQTTYQWESVYGHLEEPKPTNAPPPLGKPVQLTHYVDANLMHDIMTGKSMAACLHFFNATPGEWYSKKMATVETATYGAEFVAARTCVEQIIDICNTL